MNKDGKVESIRPTQIFAYDALGHSMGYLDSNAIDDENAYINNHYEITYQAFSTKQFDVAGNLTFEHHADGGWVKFEYDAFNRLIKKTWAVNDRQTGESDLTYNKNGNLLTQTNYDVAKDKTLLSSETYTYDEFGNRLTDTNGEGEKHTYRYDTQNHVISNNIGKHSNTTKYDAEGRKILETDAMGGQSIYVYDEATGLLKSKQIIDALNQNKSTTITYTYNDNAQVIKEEDSEGKLFIYDYFDNGLVKSITDKALNIVTAYEYNSLGQKTRETFTDTNDNLNRETQYEYNALGQLIHAYSNDYDIVNDYDAAGNKTRITTKVNPNDKTKVKTQTSSYSYDAANRILSTTKDNSTHTVSYDLMGNRISDNGKSYEFNAEGLLTGSNNMKRSYNHAGRVILDTEGNTTRLNKYDEYGNLKTQEVNDNGTHEEITYSYDDANNQIGYSVTVHDGGSGITYTNHYEKTFNGYQGSSTYFEGGHTEFHHDARGNLIDSIDTRGDGSKNKSFIYNGQGEIVQKTENGKVTSYYYQDGKPIGQINSDGTIDFDYNYTPVSENYPATTPSSYVVAQGDTLAGIALMVFGDASLWYLIANENGLKDDTGLVVGQVLNIPNQITNIHSRSDTFRKYDASSLIGDLTPTLPTPPPPDDDDDGGCGGIGGFIVAIVTVAAAVITCQPEFIGAISSGLGLAGTTAGTIVAGAVGGAIVDTAHQLAAMATGLQEGFSFKELGHAALKSLLIGNPSPISNPVGAMVQDAVSQGIDNAMGDAHGFSWREMAGSGMRAELGSLGADPAGTVELASNGQRYFANGFNDFANSTVGNLALQAGQDAYVSHGHVSVEDIVGKYVGNGLGHLLTPEYQQSAAERRAQEEELDAAMISQEAARHPESWNGSDLTDSNLILDNQSGVRNLNNTYLDNVAHAMGDLLGDNGIAQGSQVAVNAHGYMVAGEADLAGADPRMGFAVGYYQEAMHNSMVGFSPVERIVATGDMSAEIANMMHGDPALARCLGAFAEGSNDLLHPTSLSGAAAGDIGGPAGALFVPMAEQATKDTVSWLDQHQRLQAMHDLLNQQNPGFISDGPKQSPLVNPMHDRIDSSTSILVDQPGKSSYTLIHPEIGIAESLSNWLTGRPATVLSNDYNVMFSKNHDPNVVHSDDYNQAVNKSLAWLEQRGFSADIPKMSKFGNVGTAIGMQTQDKKVGFRVEYDNRTGAHINVWAGKDKGPHFTFPGDEDSVNKIIERFNRR